MKHMLFLTTAVAGLTLAMSLSAQQETIKPAHQGTWKLVSMKYGDAKEFSDFPEGHQRVKLITQTHFTWIQYDTTEKQVQSVAGGPYSLEGNVYTETIEFAGEGMTAYLGGKHAFTIRVDGDKFFLSGQLADGLKIEEIWQRVK
jgi:hypothetical protein